MHYRKSDFQAQIRRTDIGRQLFWIGIKKFLIVGLAILSLELSEIYVFEQFDLAVWPSEKVIGDYNGQLEFYAVLLAAIFSIYFATIGIVLSTGYARLNRDIVTLLVGEQVGNIYTGMLVFATAFCLTITALNTFNYQTGFIAYVLATFLTVMSVLILFPMGQRLFSFFELSPLVESEILPKIFESIDRVSKTASSVSFQNHFSLQAQNRLRQLFYIDDRLQTDKDKLKQNLPYLTKQHSSILIHYLSKKHLIPENSYWYPRKHIYKDWFLAGDNATSMALSTGSQIAPDEKPDLNWLEEKLHTRIHYHLEKALKLKDWDLALKLVLQSSHRTLECAQGLYFTVGLRDIKESKLLLEKHLVHAPIDDSEVKMQVMALVDAWTAITHNFFLETLRRMQTFDGELLSFFEKDDWSRVASKNLPSFLQLKISYLQDKIEFEQKIEGQRLSQPKYLQQLTIKAVLDYYSEIIQTIVLFENDEFISFANKLLEIKHPAAATHVILTTLHSIWKLPGWFAELDNLFKQYSKFEKYDSDSYMLPRIDIEKIQLGFENTREQLISKLTDKKLGNHLFDFEKHNSSLPDHFGQTYFILANECFSALDKNEPEKLAKVFQTFLSLSFMADNVKFADPTLDVNQEYRLHLVSTANKDIATILGYGILYAEYHDNTELQDIPITIWEKIIENFDNKKQYLERMVRLSDSHSFSMSMPIRETFRTEWKMQFEARLRDDGFGDRYNSYDRKSHPSDIVDVFRGTYYSASDVFFALKIIDEIELPDDQINHQIKNYKSQLVRRWEAKK